MKKITGFILLNVFILSCYGQSFEFCTSLNTSSEIRMQSAIGLGVQFQKPLGKKGVLGIGFHYNFNKTKFDQIPYRDADPINVIADKVSSLTDRFSFRLNIQAMLKENESFAVSLGPEMSVNYLRARDEIDENVGKLSNSNHYSQKYSALPRLGLGLISKMEIKSLFAPDLSLCLSVRPEFIVGKLIPAKGSNPEVFSGLMGFTEIQLGLVYQLKK